MRGGNLPTGTVTFLFTDVERSTRTVGEIGDERYADLQDAHRRLLREAFEAHGGVEVGTEGDAFFVAFARAGDAVAAAVAGQLALSAASELRVRIGMHTGEALVRDGDYVGHDVHKAKRVSDAGHGGQILLSQTTADLARAHHELRDLGPHRLKDLSEPERLYQVVADALDRDFPPLRTLEAFRHNLPQQRTSFLGREDELALVRKHLSGHRIVTLTGVGGCGKTRLSLQVAADVLEECPGGVYFIDLARVTDADAVMSTVANSLGISGGGFSATPTVARDEVIRTLTQDRCFVVLDNCEHLVDACAELTDDLLAACPTLRILATSREALEVDGEQTFSVPSLDTDSTSVELFLDRAGAVRPDFELTTQNSEAVVEICRRLDGVPLAIELAAAQIAHLSPAQIAERLNDRFRLLTGGRRRVQRQQTLGATLDWSHDLLPEDERTLLRRMSVFPGSFSLEAAESVGGSEMPVLSGLRSLVAKSLVDAHDEGEHIRYRMLETVRLYAEEKLLAANESEAMRERHAEHYYSLMRFDMLDDVMHMEAAELVAREAHNVRAALAWAEGTGQAEYLARLTLSGVPLWAASFDEGARWLEAALERSDELDLETRGSLLAARSWLSAHRNEWPKSIRSARAAVELAGPDPAASTWLAFSHAMLCVTWAFSVTLGEAGAREALEEHVSMLGGLVDDLRPGIAGYAALMVGQSFSFVGDLDLAIDWYERALAIYARDDEQDPNRTLLHALYAPLLYVAGRFDDALVAAERAAKDRDTWRRYSASTDYGWDVQGGAPMILLLSKFGRVREARAFADEFAGVLENSNVPTAYPSLLAVLAAVACLHADHRRAARLLGASASLGPVSVATPLFRHSERQVREALGDEETEGLMTEGRTMTGSEAVALGVEGIPPD